MVAPGETFVFGAREEAGQPEHSPKPWAEDQAEDRAYSTKKAKAFDDDHRAIELHLMKEQILDDPHPS